MEFPRNTLAKVSAPFKHINITRGENGTLVIQRPSLFFLSNVNQVTLVPIAPLLFQHANDDTLTAFGENQKGKITFAFNPIWAKIGAYERVSWYETLWVQLGLILACGLLFLSAVIVYLILPLAHRWQHIPNKHRQAASPLILAGFTGLLNLLFLISLPLSLWLIGIWKLVYGEVDPID